MNEIDDEESVDIVDLYLACELLQLALASGNKDKMTKEIANLQEALSEFMESGYIPYEAIDSELLNMGGRNERVS